MKRKELKISAKKSLKNNYGTAILYTILFNLLMLGSLSVGLFVGFILVAGAVYCSRIAFYMDLAKNKPASFDSTFRGFKYFGRALGVMVLLMLIMSIFVFAAMIMPIISVIVTALSQTGSVDSSGAATGGGGQVGIILLIVSVVVAVIIGIIGMFVAVRLSFAFHVMVDRPEMSAGKCISQSWKITKKRFFKIIGFNLSFIGWWLLTIYTLGLLSLYVMPYYYTSLCNLYFEFAEDLGPVAVPEASLDTSTVAGYLAQ